ncbi:MAG: rRNA adenine dimethyltransferase family protein, partial [Candidatus Spechtbacterales bacterium]|nr:rRNA adenine dimethyltransferase family protein [Candidatus Spechtbacterales bacterium]
MPNEVRKILEKHGVIPNKVLGQNFLTDKGVVNALVEAAEVTEEDVVLEAGPGTGTITKELAKIAKEVLAVEKDENMIRILQEELADFENIDIIHQDILKLEIKNSDYKIVAAPPYYLTGRMFRYFLEEANAKPSLIAVIIQKEVAEKICAQPPQMNLPAISVQLYGEPQIIRKVPKNAFWPVPDVDSAILVVKNITKPALNE